MSMYEPLSGKRASRIARDAQTGDAVYYNGGTVPPGHRVVMVDTARNEVTACNTPEAVRRAAYLRTDGQRRLVVVRDPT